MTPETSAAAAWTPAPAPAPAQPIRVPAALDSAGPPTDRGPSEPRALNGQSTTSALAAVAQLTAGGSPLTRALVASAPVAALAVLGAVASFADGASGWVSTLPFVILPLILGVAMAFTVVMIRGKSVAWGMVWGILVFLSASLGAFQFHLALIGAGVTGMGALIAWLAGRDKRRGVAGGAVALSAAVQAALEQPHYLHLMGAVHGPFPVPEIVEMNRRGQLPPGTVASTDRVSVFPVGQLPGISSHKDWTTLLLLSIFLGNIGLDRFYLGRWVLGLGKLVTLGGFGIWSLVDLILVVTHKMRDKHGIAV